MQDAWLYETTHLCLPDVPQPHKNVTPEYLDQRFQKLSEISNGRLWAATPDRVIDYELMRRFLAIDNVRWDGGSLCFDVSGQFPVGVMDPLVTLRIEGVPTARPHRIEQVLHQTAGGFAQLQSVESILPDQKSLLVTLQLAPGRTVRFV